MIPGKKLTFEDILRMVWRRKWLVVVPFIAVAIPTAVGTRLLKNTYKSESLILVVPQRVPESYVRSTVTDRIEGRLQSISEQILSRPRLEKIIDEFGLYAEKRKTQNMEDIVEKMKDKDVSVTIVRRDAFRVSYLADEPDTAVRVVERLASLFIEENTREREGQAEGTNRFLESQMEDARRRLSEREKQLAEYQRDHLNELPSQRSFNLQAQQSTEIRLQNLVGSLSVDRDRRLVAERLIADASAPGANASASQLGNTSASDSGLSERRAADELEAARNKLQGMLLRLKPEHPDIVAQNRVIRDLEATVRAGARAGAGNVRVEPAQSPAEEARERRIAELRQELANLNKKIDAGEAQEARLRADVATYQGRILAAPARDAELSELTRDYETIKTLYQSLLQKNEDSKLAANLERRQIGEQFKIIEPANLPQKPFSPNRPRIAAVAAVLGLMLGAGLAALVEYLDTSMRSAEDVATALGVPVLALVTSIVTEQELRRSRRTRALLRLTAALTVVLFLAGLFWKFRA